MLFAPQLATRKKKMNMENLILVIQIESMQDVHAKNLNGLYHGEDNVHIQG
jgi:hypothetical protein